MQYRHCSELGRSVLNTCRGLFQWDCLQQSPVIRELQFSSVHMNEATRCSPCCITSARKCYLAVEFTLLIVDEQHLQWRRQDFVTGGVRYGSIGGLEYEVQPQSRLYCLCINVALCSTALQCICRVI